MAALKNEDKQEIKSVPATASILEASLEPMEVDPVVACFNALLRHGIDRRRKRERGIFCQLCEFYTLTPNARLVDLPPLQFVPIMLRMSLSETIQFQATPEFRRKLEEEATKLNLSLSAYFLYLQSRMVPGKDVARLDRHVREVFGKHGALMRRLAK